MLTWYRLHPFGWEVRHPLGVFYLRRVIRILKRWLQSPPPTYGRPNDWHNLDGIQALVGNTSIGNCTDQSIRSASSRVFVRNYLSTLDAGQLVTRHLIHPPENGGSNATSSLTAIGWFGSFTIFLLMDMVKVVWFRAGHFAINHSRSKERFCGVVSISCVSLPVISWVEA